jgi:hypothetical protein
VKLVSVVALFSVLMLALTSFASGASPNSMKTFGTGDVTITGSKSATIVNAPGEYGGVYVGSKSLNGKALAKVSFEFTSEGGVGGGAPRFSIPINDGAFDPNTDYAFLDVNNCGDELVSSAQANCKVFFGSQVFDNWAAFATANPTYKIADAIPFIIADVDGSYAVTGIDLR